MSKVLIVFQEPLLIWVIMIRDCEVELMLISLHVGLQSAGRVVVAAEHVWTSDVGIILWIFHIEYIIDKVIIK